MAQIDIDFVWSKGKVVDGRDPEEWRLDCCGALINRRKYNDSNSPYGWEVDHVVPFALLKEKGVCDDDINNPDNLRPIHCQNNVSKAQDYPVYKSALIYQNGENVSSSGYFEVNKNLQHQLKLIFQKYGI